MGNIDHGLFWLDSFRDRLVSPVARDFVAWAAASSAPGVVLDRGGFGPETLLPWLGNLAILHRSGPDDEFLYRLFGTRLTEFLGRDLSGRSLDAWPEKIARVKRDRVHTVVSRTIPLVAHSARMHYEDAEPKRGFGVLEQVMWPMRYSSGSADAVLDLTVLVPQSSDLNALTLRDETGGLGRCFAADGAPLEQAVTGTSSR